MDQHAPQREHDLREVFNAPRRLVRARAAWRFLPNVLPPCGAVNQRSRRWLDEGRIEVMACEMRIAQGRQGQPVMDGRILTVQLREWTTYGL